MRIRSLAFLTAALLSCGTGGPQIHSDALGDAGVGDTSTDSTVILDSMNPDAVSDQGAELPPGDATTDDGGTSNCEGSLRSWMCQSEECDTDHDCLGYVASCEEPPCWGAWCPFIPGFCLPRVTDEVCQYGSDCESGYACAKSEYSLYGLCSWIGSGGLCLSNSDCDADSTCAGEVRGRITDAGHGPQLPGVCLEKLDSGCWDDGMCFGGWCDGAKLCVPGDDSCVPDPGVCVAGDKPECEPIGEGASFECDGSPWGNWCVGAEGFFNRWCAPPPASPAAGGQCWEDRECSPALTGNLCRSSMACPPRSFCRVAGFHSGVCGAAPADGEGLTLRFQDQTPSGEVTLAADSRIMLVNRGPVAIYVLPCGTVAVYAQKYGEWENTALEWAFSTPECTALPSTKLLLRVPPGSGLVMTIPPDSGFDDILANRYVRLGLEYWVGCEPGGTTASDMKCLEVSNNLRRSMYSPDVFWKR